MDGSFYALSFSRDEAGVIVAVSGVSFCAVGRSFPALFLLAVITTALIY